VDAGILHKVRSNKFSTIEIIKWLQEKQLAFPFTAIPQEENETSHDELHEDNFKIFTPDQQLLLPSGSKIRIYL
jgi:hypothetical protein